MGGKRALVYWHFFKPITMVLDGAKHQRKAAVPLQNRLGKELVLVQRVLSKVVLVVQQKTQIGQIV